MVNQKFLELVAENPELPIVAMVDGEIVEDPGMMWLGSITGALVSDIGLIGTRYYDERYDFMDAYYSKYSETIAEKFGYSNQDPKEVRDAAEARIDEYLEKMADKYMKKAIVIYVREPDYTIWEEA